MPASGLEDKIRTGWEGKQDILGPHENPEQLMVLVPPHPGHPEKPSGISCRWEMSYACVDGIFPQFFLAF